MTDAAALDFLHWFWTAFFAACGVYFLLRPDCMMQSSCKLLRLQDAADAPRVKAAVERRRQIERISAVTGYGCAAFCFVIAALTAYRVAAPALLYSIFCFGFAATMSAAYLQLRNSQPKRVAVLSARRRSTVIPDWVFFLALLDVAAIVPLAFLPGLALSVGIVALSSLLTIAAASRLTTLPAMLQGVDVSVETALDNRLRFNRSAGTLILGAVQPYVYASQLLVHTSREVVICYWLTCFLWIAISLWVGRKMMAKVSLAPQ